MNTTHTSLALAIWLGMAGVLWAVTPEEQDVFAERVEVTPGSDIWRWDVTWPTTVGSSYFLQLSDNMFDWNYLPTIRQGFFIDDDSDGFVDDMGHAIQDMDFEGGETTPRQFLKLKRVDIYTDDPWGADFDYDGISNNGELRYWLTDPLSFDSDEDGMDDLWEIERGMDPTDDGTGNSNNGPNGDIDGDGRTNWEEYSDPDDYTDPDTDWPGLTALWKLDDGAGTLVRNSSHVSFADGTLTNVSDLIWEPIGIHGGALSFGGTNGSVTLPTAAIDGATEFSISLWFKSDPGYLQSLFTVASSSQTRHFTVLVSSSGVHVYDDGRAKTFLTGALTNGEWHQLTLVRNQAAGTVAVFTDGQRVPIDDDNNSSTPLDDHATYNPMNALSVTSFQLGADPDTGNPVDNPFEGTLDEVRLYDRVLTDGEITSLYNLALDSDHDLLPDWWEITHFGSLVHDVNDDVDGDGTPNGTLDTAGALIALESDPNELIPSDLIAHYPLDDGDGTTIADASDYARAGTVIGVDWPATRDGDPPTKASPWKAVPEAAHGRTAFDFSEHNDSRIELPNEALDGLTNLSLAFWVRIDPSSATYHCVLNAVNTGARAFEVLLRPSNGGVLMRTVDGNFWLTPSSSPPDWDDGTWRHVTITRNDNANQYKLYVNGVLRRTLSKAISTPLSVGDGSETSATWLGLGRSSLASGSVYHRLRGLLDDVRFHNRVLSASEVTALYNTSLDSDADGLPDQWELQHFGHLGQPALGDPDADGITNAVEHTNGTDPSPEDPNTSDYGLLARATFPPRDGPLPPTHEEAPEPLLNSSSPTQPAEDDCDLHRLTSRSEASGPKYRKIGWNGYPIADDKPQQEPETDREQAESYVDALTLSLHHDINDISVPMVGGELRLEARRSVTGEVWSTGPGFLPHERVDRPFGMGWQSGLAAHVSIPTDPIDIPNSANCVAPRPDPEYVNVLDENGTAHRFLKVYPNSSTTPEFLPMPSNRTEQSAFLMSLEKVGSTYIFTRQFGTTLTYDASLANVVQRDHTYAYVDTGDDLYNDQRTVDHYRLTKVEDRFGNRLFYQYDSGNDTLIPDRIVAVANKNHTVPNPATASTEHYRVVTIHRSAHTHGSPAESLVRIDAITDPNGGTYHYRYDLVSDFGNRVIPSRSKDGDSYPAVNNSTDFFLLNKVIRPDGSAITYGYEQHSETDWTPKNPANEPSPFWQDQFYFVNVSVVRNGRGAPYQIAYQRDLSKSNFSTNTNDDKTYHISPGQPRIVRSITLPNGASSHFSTELNHTPLMVDYYKATSTSAVEPMLAGGKERGPAERLASIRDADGQTRVYQFGDAQIIDVSEFQDHLVPDANPYQRKADHLILWKSLTIHHPTGGYEAFHFDPEAGMSAWKVVDYVSPASASPPRICYFHYGDAWSVPASLNFLPAGAAFFPGKYPEPTVEVNPLHGVDYATPALLAGAISSLDPTHRKTFRYTTLTGASNARILDRVTDEDGRQTTYGIDSATGVTTSETTVGLRLQDNGNVSSGTVQTTTHAYGNSNFPGFRTSTTIEGSTNADDLVTTFVPDSFGNVAEQHVAPASLDLTTTYTHDDNGNQTSVTDPRGNTTFYRYDTYNRLVEEIYPPTVDTRSGLRATRRSYHYDGSGFKVKEIDENGIATLFVYDELGRVLHRIRDMDNNGTYSLAEREDPDSHDLYTSFTYNNVGSVLSERDPNGNTSQTVYDSLQRVVAEIDPEGAVTEYFYQYADFEFEAPTSGTIQESVLLYINDDGDTTTGSISDTPYETGGGSSVFGSGFEPLVVRDPRGYLTVFGFDARHRKTAELSQYRQGDHCDAKNYRLTQYTHDGAGNVVTFAKRVFEDSGSYHDGRTDILIDGLGRPYEVRQYEKHTGSGTPALYAFSRTHHSLTGLVTKTQDNEGRQTTYAHDDAGRLTDTYKPDPGTGSPHIITGYDANSNVISTTDARGNTSDFVFDKRNRLIEAKSPQVLDVDGKYEGAGNHTQERAVTLYGYDAVGNQTTITDARGNTTTKRYDEANRPIDVHAPVVRIFGGKLPSGQIGYKGGFEDCPVTRTYYDKNGNIVAVNDANGNVTLNKYNGRNDLVATKTNPEIVLDPDDYATADTASGADIVVVHEHDDDANVIETRVLGTGNKTTFDYDGLNRVTATKSWDSGSVHDIVSLIYDGFYKIARTDGRGRVTEFTYDQSGRLYETLYDTGTLGTLTTAEQNYSHRGKTSYSAEIANLSRKMFYDKVGNLVAVRRTSATSATSPETDIRDVTYTYDALDRLTHETSAGVKTHYTYDANGNVENTFFDYANASNYRRKVTKGYDALNRVSSIAEHEFGQSGTARTTYQYYDLNGNRTNTHSVNPDTWENRTYDAANRLTAIETRKSGWSGTLLQQFDYHYDHGSNVLGIEERSGGNEISDRLVTNSYDQVYRLIEEEISRHTDYVIGTLTTSTTAYEYDKSHNRTKKTVNGSTVTNYIYNDLNQLISTNGAQSLSFTYDLNGNRQTRSSGGQTDHYAYDLDNRLLRLKKNTSGNTGDYHNTYDHRTRRIGRTESGGADTTLAFSGGLSVQEYNGQGTTGTPKTEYIRSEGMGGGVGGMLYTFTNSGSKIRYAHSNGRGDITTRTNTSGNVTYQAGYEAFGTRPDEHGAADNDDPHKSNTKEEDPTGLVNGGYRYHDLETGTWITRDPAGHVDGPNLYTRVRQNPWSGIDADGLVWGQIKAFGRGLKKSVTGTVTGIANAGKAIYNDPKGVITSAKNEIAFQTSLLVSDVKNFVGSSEVRQAAMSEVTFEAVKHEIANFDFEEFGENFGNTAQTFAGAGMTAKIARKLPTGKNKRADGDSNNSPTEDGCFIAGTLLALSQGQEPIEEIRNGRRSLTYGDPTIPDVEIDPSTWREVTLRGENLELKQIWSPAKLEGIAVGSVIPFSNDELETHGSLTVVAIDDCPPIEDGPGRLILSTSRRIVSQVIRLEFENGHAIHGVTPNHPFYSLDRHTYVPASELDLRERIGTRSGETRLMRSEPLEGGPAAVYNVEVDAVHCYYVGFGEFLVHNTCSSGNDAAGSEQLELDLGDSRKPVTHRGKRGYEGESHVYAIRSPDGSVYKIGKSSRGNRAGDGASIRAESQVRELNRTVGPGHTSEIRKTLESSGEALDYERKLRDRVRRRYGDDKLPGNKENY